MNRGFSKNSLLTSILLHALILAGVLMALKNDVIYSIVANKINVQDAYLVMKIKVQSQMQKAIQPAQTLTAPLNPLPVKTVTSTLTYAQTEMHPSPAATAAPQPISTPLAPNQIQQLLLIIAQEIQHNLHYPTWAVTHIAQGQSLLQFQLNPQGDLQNIQLIQSSGTARLDQAAMQAITASSPIAIPSAIKLDETLTLRLPVHFSMQT